MKVNQTTPHTISQSEKSFQAAADSLGDAINITNHIADLANGQLPESIPADANVFEKAVLALPMALLEEVKDIPVGMAEFQVHVLNGAVQALTEKASEAASQGVLGGVFGLFR